MVEQFVLSPRAAQLINGILEDLVSKGYLVNRLTLHVSPDAQLSSQSSIMTNYGLLEVKINQYAYKGIAYIMGHSGCKGFAWVSRPSTNK